MDALIAEVAGWGVDKVNLTKTLADFSLRARGGDVQLDALSRDLSSDLKVAPFFALEVQPAITFPFGGLRINTNGEALREDGSSVPGLFVAGVDAGGFSNWTYAGGLSGKAPFFLPTFLT